MLRYGANPSVINLGTLQPMQQETNGVAMKKQIVVFALILGCLL
jgi:hypothetical protein